MSSWTFRRRTGPDGTAKPGKGARREVGDLGNDDSPAGKLHGRTASRHRSWSFVGTVAAVASTAAIAVIAFGSGGESSIAAKNESDDAAAVAAAAATTSRVASPYSGGKGVHVPRRRMGEGDDVKRNAASDSDRGIGQISSAGDDAGVGLDDKAVGDVASDSGVGLAQQQQQRIATIEHAPSKQTLALDSAVVAAAAADDSAPKRCPAGSRVPSIDSQYLHSLFTRLSSDAQFAHLGPSVVSRGGPSSDDAPWALVLDDFLSASELKAAVDYLRSSEARTKFGISGLGGGSQNYNYRRSESMNCQGPCLSEPWINPMVERMTELLGLNMRHAEDVTLTHYGKGGFYGRHHDYILETSNPPSWRNCGSRILTFLVYLNDVEEGGATSFFHLGLDVEPKPGRALIFPNVFPDKPREKDERTAHEAKIVEKGEKFIAQTWFHLYDYQANKKESCC